MSWLESKTAFLRTSHFLFLGSVTFHSSPPGVFPSFKFLFWLFFNQGAWRNDGTQNSELQSRAINLLENPFIDNRAHKLRHSHTLSRVSCAVLRQLLLLLRHFRNEQFQRWRPSWMTTAEKRKKGGKKLQFHSELAEPEEHVNDDDDNDGSCQASPPACIIIIKHTDTDSRIGLELGPEFGDCDCEILLDGQGQSRGMRRSGASWGIAPRAVLKASTQISSKV